ncbi:MAG: type II secretion system protein [Planctomycetota bacterium]|nr:type II secretion system protein [Planctomycetota bacterium]
MTRRTNAFTLVELMVVISIIALLVGILLPAISRARDNAKIGQSKSNIRNVKAATDLYEMDHGGQLWTGSPENLASGPDGSWTGLTIDNAYSLWRSRYWSGSQGGAGNKLTILPGVHACEGDHGWHEFTTHADHVAPYCFGEGLTTSNRGFARLGTWRFPNTRQIAEYMDDKCYHKTFWAPKDRIIQRALQQCWDDDGTMCSTTHFGDEGVLDIPHHLQPSSYAYSPPNLVHPNVYRQPNGEEDPIEAFADPMSFPSGFRAATVAQAKYSSLKTSLMETHWLQNLTTGECGPRWEDATYNYHVPSGSGDDDSWSYNGCYPNYFNASWRSAPVAIFVDGHVDMIECQEAEKHDYVVADGNDSTGALAGYKGLWHRGVAGDGENGFFVECRTDWGNWSGHTHSSGGITQGRDVLAE